MKKITFLSCVLTLLLLTINAQGQVYQHLTMTGFNADVIANGVGTPTGTTNNDVDGAGYCFKSLDWLAAAGGTPQTRGLPINGLVTTAVGTTPGLTYQFQNYSSNNSIRLTSALPSITSTISGAPAIEKLFVLTTSGSGVSRLEVVVNFTDNTSQTFTPTATNVNDWYGGANFAIQGIGRLNLTGTTGAGDLNNTTDPRIYQLPLVLSVANQSKIISSIVFNRLTASAGVINIFGVSAEILPTCPSPSTATPTIVSATQVNMNWAAPAIVPQNGYQYELRTTGTAGSGATGLVSGASTTALTASFPGLQPSTAYSFYIRSICSSENGVWKLAATFSTPCAVATVPFLEGFEVGYTNAATVVGCWTQVSTTGTQTWTANNTSTDYNRSPRTGAWNAYLRYSNEDWMFYPIQLTAGTNYQLKFYARQDGSTAANASVKASVGSVNTVAGMTIPVVPQTNIINGGYQELINYFNVPTTGVYYIGINGNINGSPWYISIDDISVIVAPTCFEPTNVVFSNITKNSATIAWTAPTMVIPSNGYAYEIRTSGVAGSGATGLAQEGTTGAGVVSKDVSGLTPSTTYSVYVRSVCGASDLSVWTLVKTFTTLCNYPDLLSTTPDVICGVGSGQLSATSSGGILQWFNSLTGVPLYTGNEFTTPEVSETTTFYVRTGNVVPNQIAQVGTATTTSSSPGDSPYYHGWGGQKAQYIFTAQELSTAGLSAGPISSLAFDVTSAGSTLNGFTLHIGTTTQSAATTTYVTGLTEVIASYANVVTVGLNTYAFSTPFNWDGTSNIVIQTSYSNNNYGGSSSTVRFHNAGFVSSSYRYADAVTATAMLNNTTASSTLSNRPNTYFNGNVICASPKQPVVLTVTPPAELTLSTSEVDICQGNNSDVITITTGADDYDTFVWTPATGVIGDAVNGWMINAQQTGIYTLRASQSNGACVLDIPVQVNVSEVGYLDLEDEYLVCKNDVLELSVIPDSSAKIILGAFSLDSTPITGFTHNNTSGTTIAANTTVFNEGTGSIRFSHGSSASGNLAMTNSIDGSGGDGIILEFDNIALLEGSSWDYGFVQYSLNGGTTWVTFTPAQYVGTASTTDDTATAKRFTINSYPAWSSSSSSTTPTNTMWRTERFLLNSTLGDLSQVKVRFALISDSVFNYYGWMLDNVKIFKETTPVTEWSPVEHLYLDAAATQPYTGEDIQTVYFKHNVEGNYNVSATISNQDVNCIATTTTIVKVPLVILPVMENQVYCAPTSVENLIFDHIEGYVYTWYANATSAATISTINTSGTYYLQVTSNEGGCKSSRVPVEIIIADNLNPTVNASYTFCDQATFENIQVGTQYGAAVQWFSTADSTTVLPANTQLSTATYYVRLAIGDCISERKPVSVTILQTPAPIATQEFTVCFNTPLSQLSLGATNIKWYFNQTSTTALGVSAVAQNNTYYVTTFNGICESARIPVVVNVVQQLQMPTAATQNFCGSGTVSQLTATGAVSGAEYAWYNSATSTAPLQPTAALQNGTYYVSQKLTNCESPRRPVTVKVTNLTAPTSTSFEFCGSATVADLSMPVISGITYNWYLPNQTTPLAVTASLVTGNYLVSKAQNGCESTKTIVQVTIKPRPASPTGSLTQNFIDSAMISDLVMDQSNVIWYVTYEDALNGNNPLQTNMPIEDGHIYYGVVIGSNGCPSLPTAVTATITLGVKDLDLASLKYYPNPVDSELTISYKEQIKLIEIYDLLGKQIKVQKFDSNDIRVNVSGLSSGTYMFRVQTNTGSQFIKIIKK